MPDSMMAPQSPTRFLSAEDFDHTGILTGVDPYASSYWWMPELHATSVGEEAFLPAMLQAT